MSTLSNKFGGFISSRGYGWMLETEEEDEIEKPLLEELDINISGIFKKIKRVLVPFGGTEEEWFKLLDDSEFWGSFFMVLLYSILIVWHQLKVVSWVFWIWILGSISIWLIATIWSSYSCVKFLIVNDTIKDKRMMMNYPIWLLYIYLITFHSGV
eukprot:gene8122-12582_t